MALAQVVYTMSTDADFAARMRSNPESALEERGLRLGTEELELLVDAITTFGKNKLDDLLVKARNWI
jgi:hypothetical protein